MTSQTIGAGIGLVLISVGILIIVIVRSAATERRAARARTERIIRVSTAAVVTPKDATGLDDLWLELLAAPARVPFQRRPGGAS